MNRGELFGRWLSVAMLIGIIVLWCLPKPDAPPYEKYKIKPQVEKDTISADSILKRKALNEIKQYEGLVLSKTGGFVGYGHYDYTGKIKSVTKEQADSILVSDINACMALAAGFYPDKPFNQLLALAMLIYNIGIGTFCKKNLHKVVDIDTWRSLCHYEGAIHKGLLHRRNFEIRVYCAE